MSEQDKENSAIGADEVTDTQDGASSAIKSEDVTQLEAQKAKLEAEIAGLEGAKSAKISELERARKEKAEAKDQIDPEAIKSEVKASVLDEVKPIIDNLQTEIQKAKANELAAKKQALESINARMASASGSKGQASPDSIVENEVELSKDEKEMASIVGLQNPRYLKEAKENSRL
jgi:hypothetical protein